MFKRKKNKRNEENIGRRQYGFDLKYEKCIYLYVCARHMSRGQKKKLKEEHKFNTYKEWKKYIIEKYAPLDKVGLECFSRYLNQSARNVELNNAYWVVCISALLSVFLTEMFKLFIVDKVQFENAAGENLILSWILLIIVFFVFLFLPMLFFIKKITDPIFDYGEKKSLFVDYKEVIDEMIALPEKQKGSTITEDNCIMIDSDRMEFKNIKADVSIETAQVSISIKQKI